MASPIRASAENIRNSNLTALIFFSPSLLSAAIGRRVEMIEKAIHTLRPEAQHVILILFHAKFNSVSLLPEHFGLLLHGTAPVETFAPEIHLNTHRLESVDFNRGGVVQKPRQAGY